MVRYPGYMCPKCNTSLKWRRGFTRLLAVLLAALLMLVDAAMSHPFWKLGGAAQSAQLLHFMKNIAIAGGFLDPGMELITKPFEMAALVSRLRAMLEGEALPAGTAADAPGGQG